MKDSKEKYVCTECWNIIIPDNKNTVFYGEDVEIDSLCHAPPCGDGLNDDSSVLVELEQPTQDLVSYAQDRVNFYKELSNNAWEQVDFIMKKVFKIRSVMDWHRFLATKGFPKYKKLYKRSAIEKWRKEFERKV